ncbi:hypothetical protein BAXH7_00500 [Bacillus amyloliquefaciens XH7]|nr:hypothetical protein LL3_00493 [Bacillus amyloliquefaciens LL3]AEK87646.1 hypothetical protein BAXH7_00500 [Bacillus amyloliquefaciens XH7]KYC93120.1 hypothetical protein B425_0487 [Bacillus amyloliquefaciens]QBG54915.1 hypothetical protein D2M30_0557 [Bacillus amyloliquefaciens]
MMSSYYQFIFTNFEKTIDYSVELYYFYYKVELYSRTE